VTSFKVRTSPRGKTILVVILHFPPYLIAFPETREGLVHSSNMRARQFSKAGVNRLASQNHRMVGVGRDPCGSPSPTPLPKQGHPEQAAQDLTQAGFEDLQRRRLHSRSGQPVPVFHQPQSAEVPCVQMELPVLQFVLIAPCPVTGHH